MQLNPHLHFAGQCEEAFNCYAQIFGGTVVFKTTYAETPAAESVPIAWRNKIIHATMVAHDKTLMGCDAPPDRYEKPRGFSVALGLNDPSEVERVFKALAENATIIMPLQQTFWSLRFGMLIDRFSIPWMINCQQGPPPAGQVKA